MSTRIREAWLGPGRKDGEIKPIQPKDDGLHINMNNKSTKEWWYFDAHLENGYTVVGFFRAKHERTGRTAEAKTPFWRIPNHGRSRQRTKNLR